MSFIEELRALGNFDGDSNGYGGEYDERLETIDDLQHYSPRYSKKPYTVEVVESTFEDLGRWSNYETKVYKVEENGEVAYFEYGREVPATEMQDGMDLSYHFSEVVPKEVVTVKYVAKNS